MFLISIYRVLKTSGISLWRNRWLSLAATLIMLVTLFIISFFGGLILVTNKTTASLRDKVDMSVYFNETASKDQILAIQNLLFSRSDIKNVDYISKEMALERWKERNKDNEKIRDIVNDTYNPLPRSLEIKTVKPENLEGVFQFLNSDDYKPVIKEISYKKNKDLVDRLVKITSFVEYLGWTLSGLFVLISVLIIYNTIRLTIFARSNEIEIMRLVGASDWHVQGPFILEGIAYGLLASVAATVISYIALKLTIPATEYYLSLDALQSGILNTNYWLIFLLQASIGLVLGISCSLFAIRKYLK